MFNVKNNFFAGLTTADGVLVRQILPDNLIVQRLN